jgi:hypothetical protein
MYRLSVSRTLAAAWLAAVLLGGGCAWYTEEKERAEILDTPSMDHAVAEVATFASSREQWPNDQWWTGFFSPELSAWRRHSRTTLV